MASFSEQRLATQAICEASNVDFEIDATTQDTSPETPNHSRAMGPPQSLKRKRYAPPTLSAGHPLIVDNYYMGGRLVEPKPPDVKIKAEEADSVREVYQLCLQSLRAHERSEPTSLDVKGDITWCWRSVVLTSSAYGKFIHVAKKSSLWNHFNLATYDWIPDEGNHGTIIIRKGCPLQKELTREIASEINKSVAQANADFWSNLKREVRATVLVGDKLGMRTPCRCLGLIRKGLELDPIRCFVLEVGIAEKSKDLPKIARSYIERGTMCVMTANIHRSGEYGDLSIAYSLYHRGEEVIPTAEGVTRYSVKESVTDFVPNRESDGSVQLTQFDFFPAEDLEKHGLTGPGDPRATVVLAWKDLACCFEVLWNCFGGDIARDNEELEHLLGGKTDYDVV
ncbi:MAG: hypothetical protein Q9210_001918 [Variospora velana]